MAGLYENLIDECREITKEGKVPADKDSEETKIKKLIEGLEGMDISKIEDDELVAKYEEAQAAFDSASIEPGSGIAELLVKCGERLRSVGWRLVNLK